MNEMQWRDRRIVQVDYKGPDCYGFKMHTAFEVRDEFDEPALPVVQHQFWSPADAIAAVECCDIVAPKMIGKKWPSTVQYEFNLMLLYRRNHDLVYDALRRIREAVQQARDFDENPSDAILGILNGLHATMDQRRAV